jgi:hypothetical protein
VGFNCYIATFEVVDLSEPFAKYHLPEYEALGWAIIEIAHKR